MSAYSFQFLNFKNIRLPLFVDAKRWKVNFLSKQLFENFRTAQNDLGSWAWHVHRFLFFTNLWRLQQNQIKENLCHRSSGAFEWEAIYLCVVFFFTCRGHSWAWCELDSAALIPAGSFLYAFAMSLVWGRVSLTAHLTHSTSVSCSKNTNQPCLQLMGL